MPLRTRLCRLACAGISATLLSVGNGPAQPPPARAPQAAATTRTSHSAAAYIHLNRPSPDGIGKVYMGREIAQVMGHLGAGWLERPEREQEEKPRLLIDNLKLEDDDVVADIGAGTGYFTFRLAERLPRGRVLATDIQPEMLDLLRTRAEELGVENIERVLGKVDNPNLPAGSVDLVLMVDSYHEFDHPREMMAGIVRALKPGGRVALVEYRGEDPEVPIRPLHRMTEAQAKLEMAAAGLEHAETLNVLPRQHLIIFQKPGAATRPASGQ